MDLLERMLATLNSAHPTDVLGMRSALRDAITEIERLRAENEQLRDHVKALERHLNERVARIVRVPVSPAPCYCGADGNHPFDGSHSGVPQPEEADWLSINEGLPTCQDDVGPVAPAPKEDDA